MEEEQFEKTPRKAARWFRAFIVLSLLYGITFSLNSLFNWIFFFAAAYSFFMSYFTLPMQPKIFQPRGSQFGSGGRATMNVSPDSPVDRAKTIAKVIGVSIVGLFVFLFVIGLLFGEEDETQTSQPEEQESLETTDTTDDSAASLVSKGHEFYNSQEYDSAEKYYELALTADPDYMEAVYGQGIVLYQKGSKDEAYGYFTRAYEGGYRYAWLSWALADMYDKRGAASRAIDLYKESVNLDSSYTDSYSRLAELVPGEREKYLQLAEKHKN